MAQKFGANNGASDVVVKGENFYGNDPKMATDTISLMSIETDRSNTSGAQRGHKHTGK